MGDHCDRAEKAETAAALRPDAVRFARAGYLVVAFDYRGWGNSDSRLVAAGKPEKKDGKLVAEVKEVREVVDPIDQTTDILNAISWAAGEKHCDKDRIGIWGSSFSGGHVVYVAARDPRVKAVRLRRNFGQAAATRAGFDAAAGDVIVTMDGDLQNDPADIPRLVAKLEEGYDAVIGQRANRQDRFLLRKVPSLW